MDEYPLQKQLEREKALDVLETCVQPVPLCRELAQSGQLPQEHLLYPYRPKLDLEAVPDLLCRAQLEEKRLGGQEMVKGYYKPLPL